MSDAVVGLDPSVEATKLLHFADGITRNGSIERIMDRTIDRMTRGLPAGERRDRIRREMAPSDPATVLQAARAVIQFWSRDWAAGIDVPAAVVITTQDQAGAPAPPVPTGGISLRMVGVVSVPRRAFRFPRLESRIATIRSHGSSAPRAI